MSNSEALPFTAAIDQYQVQAEKLLLAVHERDENAEWRFKWVHPRFHGKSRADVKVATLESSDAQLVIAREYAFENWTDLAAFSETIRQDGPVSRFETTVECIISGDVTTLRDLLVQYPELIRRRSTRKHHATALHYIAANGVEGMRQKTPLNMLEIGKLLLEAGAALRWTRSLTCTSNSARP
jgi:hypothetical protein